jgi:hypothetical protein
VKERVLRVLSNWHVTASPVSGQEE